MKENIGYKCFKSLYLYTLIFRLLSRLHTSFYAYACCLFCICISSCTFRPLYSIDHYSPKNEQIWQNQIDINVEKNIQNTILKTFFLSHLNYNTNFGNNYKLNIKFDLENLNLILRENSEVLKKGIELLASFELIDTKSNKKIFFGAVPTIGSYNTITSPFTSYMFEESLEEDMLKYIALEINRRLVIFFETYKNGA